MSKSEKEKLRKQYKSEFKKLGQSIEFYRQGLYDYDYWLVVATQIVKTSKLAWFLETPYWTIYCDTVKSCKISNKKKLLKSEAIPFKGIENLLFVDVS